MSSWYEEPMIAYDNSNTCQIALQIFFQMKNKFTKAHILHVSDSNKVSYTPLPLSTATIQKHLKSKFPQQNKQNITIQIRQKGTKSINEIILQSFISNGLNLLFLGFVGSKGLKSNQKNLSSRVRQFVYESKLNLAIIKKQPINVGKVIFCCDGSQLSLQGLIKANQFCQTYEKKLTVIHITNDSLKTHSKHVKNQLKNLQTSKKDLKFDLIISVGNIIEWLKQNQQQYQWIIINSNGYRGSISKKRYVGSNATNIIQSVNCNLILLKE